jgi:hypothetical protein
MTIEDILPHTTLDRVNGEWTLHYRRREYICLLDATSREDAETQIAEMLFMQWMKNGGNVVAGPGRSRASRRHGTVPKDCA